MIASPVSGDDFALLDSWCAGDKSAGNQLFKRHFETIYRFFEHKVDTDIDDLVQETFLACVKSRDSFRRQSSFKTFLLSIARHTLFGYWRKRAPIDKNLDFEEISVASLSTSAGTKLAKEEDRAALLSALRGLPLDQQLLLEMFYWEELDREQLAEVFEVEQSTIGTRLFRARQALMRDISSASEVAGNLDRLDTHVRLHRSG